MAAEDQNNWDWRLGVTRNKEVKDLNHYYDTKKRQLEVSKVYKCPALWSLTIWQQHLDA